MGIRYVSERIYSCPHCNFVQEEEHVLSYWIKPIKFDYLIQKCMNPVWKITQ